VRATANPGGEGHAWIKRRFVDICGEDGSHIHVDSNTGLERRFIPAKLNDNPSLDLNDPSYRLRLEGLPEILRRQLLDGDWGASVGVALDELSRDKHLIDPFVIPNHWGWFASLDWGFAHPMAYGVFAVGPDKQVFLVDSLHLRRNTPIEIIERIDDKLIQLGRPKLKYTVAGRDCWHDIKARGENTPTMAELFSSYGHPLMKANVSRVSGLNNLRQYLTSRGMGGVYMEPRFKIFKTRGNLHTMDILEQIVTDPRDREDAMKVDADEYGDGGDDPYDMVRYGLASRPLTPMAPKKKPIEDRNWDAGWDKLVKANDMKGKFKKRSFPW
jgi:hypothetical protein